MLETEGSEQRTTREELEQNDAERKIYIGGRHGRTPIGLFDGEKKNSINVPY